MLKLGKLCLKKPYLKKLFLLNPFIKTHLFFIFFSSSISLAGDLRPPFELESSKILPKGIINPRLKTAFSPTAEKWNGGGKVEPLGAPLNKTVSWKEVIDSQSHAHDKASIQSVLGAAGLSESGDAGSVTGNVNSFASIYVPVLSYGVTERWTLAAAVPVVKAEVNASTGFVRTLDGQKFVDQAAVTSEMTSEDAAKKLNNSLNDILISNGYEPIQSQKVTAIGDIKLVSKYLINEDSSQAWTLKTDLTLPTGKEANANRLIDLPTGDGQTDFGTYLIYDAKRLVGNFGINVYTGYTLQFPDQVEKRIPDRGKTITPDKEVVTRDLGDIFSTGTALVYEIPNLGLSFGSGYHFQYLSATTHAGSQFDSHRYELLNAQTPLQALHSITVSGGFSTVSFYRQGKFGLPFDANLSYSRTLVGRNTLKTEVFAGEIVAFF